jgi:hypothetical protein
MRKRAKPAARSGTLAGAPNVSGARSPVSLNPIEIEKIQEMRQREGVEDADLRAEIRSLEVGDLVRITLLSGNQAAQGETVQVRLTSIRGLAFQGVLTSTPVSSGLAELRSGSPIAFTAAHIHSVPKGRPARG